MGNQRQSPIVKRGHQKCEHGQTRTQDFYRNNEVAYLDSNDQMS